MIRKAQKEDVKKTMFLLALAMEHFIYKLSGKEDYNGAMEILENFFLQENNRLSYENICVYEEDGEILGAICFYDGARAEFLDMPLKMNLKALGKQDTILKECEDEFYLDSVAVDEKARGKGIAKKLILYAQEEAQKAQKKLSLIVETQNEIAKKTYDKLGFKCVNLKKFHGHLYEYRELI